MDRSVFSTKYKTKDEYSLRASNNLRPFALQEELGQEKFWALNNIHEIV